MDFCIDFYSQEGPEPRRTTALGRSGPSFPLVRGVNLGAKIVFLFTDYPISRHLSLSGAGLPIFLKASGMLGGPGIFANRSHLLAKQVVEQAGIT